MGLSGRRDKQRIGKDPRNLSWADDASRFGQAYLAKFGWDASKGLGASGEGRTSAITATQKLDMLGIGMRHQNDLEGGVAWRQNQDFEDLLRRLNEGTTTETTELLDSFYKARDPKPELLEGGSGVEKVKTDDDGEEEREGVMAKKEKKKKEKKGKRKATTEAEEELEEEGHDGKKRKKKRKKSSSKDDDGDGIESEHPEPPRPCPPRHEASHADEPVSVPVVTATTRPTAVTAPVPIRAPPRTHRARIIAAKRMAASNSTALAEILGIPSSSSSSARPSAVASPIPVISDPALAGAPTTTTTTTTSNATAATATTEVKDSPQKLTTSSQSVSDYFRAKLNAKATLAAVGGTTAPASARDGHDGGRAGLGFGGGPWRAPPRDSLDEEPVRGGIGISSSSSRFAIMFMPGQPTTKALEENTITVGVEPVTYDVSDPDDDHKKSEKKRAKEERRREKEERRRKRAEDGHVDPSRGAVDVPVDEAPAARSKKKNREPVAPDGRLEDSHFSGAGGKIATKKRKKDKKSSKHRVLEE